MIKQMNLAWISVSDIAQAKKFFVETLGMQIEADAPDYGWLEVSGKDENCMRLGIGQARPESAEKPGMNAVVTMIVDDIVIAKKELTTKGVQFVGDIIEVPGHVKLATFLDPDNNMFQLVQMLSNNK